MKILTRRHHGTIKQHEANKGFNMDKYTGIDKEKTLRNCVEPKTGLHVFSEAFKQQQHPLIP